MADETLGQLTAQLGADLTDMRRAMDRAEGLIKNYERVTDKELDQAENRWKKYSAAVSKRSRAMYSSVMSLKGAMAGLGASLVIGDTIRKGAQFEHTMTKVGAVANATQGQLQDLTAVARKMGETTEWSATQAASGLEFLSMAGFKAKQSIGALPGVLDLATAGNIELGRAADIASNVLTAMQMPVRELTTVNDTFVKAITSANINMEMMAESFKYAGSIGAAFGYDVQEIAGYIGQLGNAGIQGSMAGTQLAMAFQKAGEVFERYGVNAKESQKYTNDLMGAMKLLEDRGASAQEVMNIFGQRAGRGVAALLGIGTDAINKYTQALTEAEGITGDIAEQFRTTTIGRFKELRSVIESIQIDLFNQQAGALNETLQDTTKYLRENKEEIIAFVNSGVEGAKNLAKALKPIGTFLTDLLEQWNNIPTEIQTVGIIGAMLFGKKGVAAIAASLEGSKLLAEAIYGSADATEQLENKLKDLQESAHNLRDGLLFFDEGSQQAENMRKELKRIEKQIALTEGALEIANNEIETATKNSEGNAKAIEYEAKNWDSLKAKVVEAKDAYSKLPSSKEYFFSAGYKAPAGIGKMYDYSDELEEYRKKHEETMNDVVRDTEKAASEMNPIWDNFLEDLQRQTASTFRTMLDEGLDRWDTWADGVEDIFKDLLAKIAAMFAQQKIILPIMAQMNVPGAAQTLGQVGGIGEAGGLVGGGGFGGGGFGGIASKIPGVGGLLGTTLPGTGAMTVPTAVGGAGATMGTASTMTLGGALGMGGLGAMGYGTIGEMIGLPQGGYSGVGSAVGGAGGAWAGSSLAALGSAGGPIGTAIGAALGGALGSLFGEERYHKPWVSYGVGEEQPEYDTLVNQRGDASTGKFGFFADVQRRSAHGMENEKIESAFVDYFNQLFTGIGESLDVSMDKVLSSDSAYFPSNYIQKYFEEEGGGVQQMLSDMTDKLLQTYADELIGAATGNVDQTLLGGDFVEQIKQEGQSFTEALNTAVTVLQAVPDAMSRIRDYMEEGASKAEAFGRLQQQYQQVSSLLTPAIEAGLSASIESLSFSDFRQGLTANLEKQMQQAVVMAAKQQMQQSMIQGAFDQAGGLTDLVGSYMSGDIGIEKLSSSFDRAMGRIEDAMDEDAFQRFADVLEELGLTTQQTTEQMTASVDRIDRFLTNIQGGGDLAPVQSMEFFERRYDQLMSQAGETGAQEDVRAAVSFAEKYLEFSKGYGGGYKGRVATVETEMQTLRKGLTGGKSLGDVYRILESIDAHIQGNGGNGSGGKQTVTLQVDRHKLGEVVAELMKYDENVAEQLQKTITKKAV